MKKYRSLAVVIVVLASYACQNDSLTGPEKTISNDLVAPAENTSSSSQPANRQTFSRKVGKSITHKTGKKWIDNFRRVADRSSPAYIVRAKAFKDLLGNFGCVGISFQFARGNSGEILILPIGVDQNGTLMETDSVITQTGTIDWHTAQQWISRYTGPVKSHFFGADTFSRLLTENTSAIYLTEALDDANSPQLLLSKGNASQNEEEEDDDYEDGSWPCPPVCP